MDLAVFYRPEFYFFVKQNLGLFMISLDSLYRRLSTLFIPLTLCFQTNLRYTPYFCTVWTYLRWDNRRSLHIALYEVGNTILEATVCE